MKRASLIPNPRPREASIKACNARHSSLPPSRATPACSCEDEGGREGEGEEFHPQKVIFRRGKGPKVARAGRGDGERGSAFENRRRRRVRHDSSHSAEPRLSTSLLKTATCHIARRRRQRRRKRRRRRRRRWFFGVQARSEGAAVPGRKEGEKEERRETEGAQRGSETTDETARMSIFRSSKARQPASGCMRRRRRLQQCHNYGRTLRRRLVGLICK